MTSRAVIEFREAAKFFSLRGESWSRPRTVGFRYIRVYRDDAWPWWPNEFEIPAENVWDVWDKPFEEGVFFDSDHGTGIRIETPYGTIRGQCRRNENRQVFLIGRYARALEQSGVTKVRWFSFDPFLSDVDKMLYLSALDSLKPR